MVTAQPKYFSVISQFYLNNILTFKPHFTMNMKKSILLFSICLAFLTNNLFATHTAGGELIYDLVPGTTNTYNFLFKFYRVCAGTTEPTSFSMCYTSPCTGTIQTVTLPKIVGNINTTPPVPNGTVLSDGCDSTVTDCTDPNSTIPGYEQWWYSATVTLPSGCNAWRFWVTLCCRNTGILNLTAPSGSQNIYVETTFDNSNINTVATSNLNSSPRFLNSNSPSSLPIPYVCVNSLYLHNGGAVDPDGDSLSFETIAPRHQTGCNATLPNSILVIPTYNILNTAGNPLACNNTYNLDQQTGAFSFIPSQTGVWVISQKINEWRKDANGLPFLIGTTMRDMQIIVDNCAPFPVISDSVNVISGGSVSNDTIKACMGYLNFCFNIINPDSNGNYVKLVGDNVSTNLPGAIVTYTKPFDSVLNVCIEWTSTIADTGNHTILITVKDSVNCKTNPANFPKNIFIYRPLKAWADTTICVGDTAQLHAYGNGKYIWTVLPGGSPISSLSCTTCPEPFATPLVTTSYVVEDSICQYKDTLVVTVLTGPPLTITPDTTTCVNATLQLEVLPNNSALYTYSWAPFSYLSSTTIANPVVQYPLASTSYTVTVRPIGILDCPSIATVDVSVLNGYLIGNKDTAICDGDAVQINGSGGSPKYTYSWTPTTFVSNPGILNPLITPTPAGVYPYSFTASFPGCPDSSISIEISVDAIPIVDAGIDREMCNGDTIHMHATVSPVGPNYTYSWDPASDLSNSSILDPIFDGNTSTIFTLTATSPIGCKGDDNVLMNVIPSDFLVVQGDVSICPNDTATLLVGGGVKYLWQPSYYVSDSNAASVKAFPISTTTFYVYGYDAKGCLDTAKTTVVVNPGAIVDAGNNATIYPGESTELFASGNCSFFTWSPPNGLSNTNIKNPIAQPSVTTRYFVTAATEAGCTGIDSVDVIVSPETILDLPNAFSPGSGTSTNDQLSIIVRGIATLNSFKIFNRWGQLVFSTTDISKGWNGQYNGKPQPMGAYVYVIDAVSSSGKRFYKQGNVTLLR